MIKGIITGVLVIITGVLVIIMYACLVDRFYFGDGSSHKKYLKVKIEHKIVSHQKFPVLQYRDIRVSAQMTGSIYHENCILIHNYGTINYVHA